MPKRGSKLLARELLKEAVAARALSRQPRGGIYRLRNAPLKLSWVSLGVRNLVFYTATCGPKGGLPLPGRQRRLFKYDRILSQIKVIDPSRSGLPYLSAPIKPPDKRKRRIGKGNDKWDDSEKNLLSSRPQRRQGKIHFTVGPAHPLRLPLHPTRRHRLLLDFRT